MPFPLALSVKTVSQLEGTLIACLNFDLYYSHVHNLFLALKYSPFQNPVVRLC